MVEVAINRNNLELTLNKLAIEIIMNHSIAIKLIPQF